MSCAFERPASDTSEGNGGTSGTFGNKKANNDEPRGLGRRLFGGECQNTG